MHNHRSQTHVGISALSYELNALEPHLSRETLDFHYNKHHQGYVNKLNAAAEKDPSLLGQSFESLIKSKKGGVFNLAAQIWNHSFYWQCLAPNAGGEPGGVLAEALVKNFGSFTAFQAEFNQVAAAHFGSGWTWLVEEAGTLKIVETHDADNPLRVGQKPLLTCDVWEHAYYIDYRNQRPKYIEAFWQLVNWDFVAVQLS